VTPKVQVVFSDAFCTLGKGIGTKDTSVAIWGIEKYKTDVMIEDEEEEEEEKEEGGGEEEEEKVDAEIRSLVSITL